MKARTIANILYADRYDMGGMPIRQPFPTYKVEQIDPFILLHHAIVKVPTHLEPAHAGVGPHPHRGFSPVTFIFKGGVHHRDSRGNNSVIYEGGAQWINAGMGIIHSERPPHDIHERGGIQEIIQLWINTPAKHKMDQPSYYPLTAEATPSLNSDDKLVTLKLQSGSLLGLHGPIPAMSELNAATLEFKKGGSISIPIPANHNAFVYLLDGKLNVETFGLVDPMYAVQFKNDGEGVTLSAVEDTRILLMTGVPLKEKLVKHGPFVMNSDTQILEAMRDYKMGKMGVLIE
jgi:hypothetical protein